MIRIAIVEDEKEYSDTLITNKAGQDPGFVSVKMHG